MRKLKNIAILRTMFYNELWMGLLVQCADWNLIRHSQSFQKNLLPQESPVWTENDCHWLKSPLELLTTYRQKVGLGSCSGLKEGLHSYNNFSDVPTKNHRKGRISERATENNGQGGYSQVVEPGSMQGMFPNATVGSFHSLAL